MLRRYVLSVSFIALLVLVGCGSQEVEEPPIATPVPTYDVARFAGSADTFIGATSLIVPESTPMAIEGTESSGIGIAATPTPMVVESEPQAGDEPSDEESAFETQIDAGSTVESEPTADSDGSQQVETIEAADEEVDAVELSPTELSTVELSATVTPTIDLAVNGDMVEAETAIDGRYVGLPDSIAALMSTADAERGEQISLANGCIGCHNLNPDLVMAGPTWYNVGDTAANRVEGQSAAFYLYTSIVNPNDYIVEGYNANIMLQTYGETLSEQEQADLVAYLLSLKEE